MNNKVNLLNGKITNIMHPYLPRLIDDTTGRTQDRILEEEMPGKPWYRFKNIELRNFDMIFV